MNWQTIATKSRHTGAGDGGNCIVDDCTDEVFDDRQGADESSPPPHPSSRHSMKQRIMRHFLQTAEEFPVQVSFPLFSLPPKLLSKVISHLDESDLKSFSLSCYRVFDALEGTRYNLPRLRVLSYLPHDQRRRAVRFLTDLVPIQKRLLEEPTFSRTLYSEYYSQKTERPSYDELQRSHISNAFRTRRPLPYFASQVWLCPHRSCSFLEVITLWKDLFSITHLNMSIVDPRQALCVFPKCAIWARHGIGRALSRDAVLELSSSIKLYRSWCHKDSDPSEILRQHGYLDRVDCSMGQLHMAMCSHLKISDNRVRRSAFDPMVWISASAWYVSQTDLQHLEIAFDKNHCHECRIGKTYTTWGFYARKVDAVDGYWLDVEMQLCRPLISILKPSRDRVSHWNAHTIDPEQMRTYVDSWWNWAEQVAEGGFDWRTPLQAGHLRRSGGYPLDFPNQLACRDSKEAEFSRRCDNNSKALGPADWIVKAFETPEWECSRRELEKTRDNMVKLARMLHAWPIRKRVLFRHQKLLHVKGLNKEKEEIKQQVLNKIKTLAKQKEHAEREVKDITRNPTLPHRFSSGWSDLKELVLGEAVLYGLGKLKLDCS